MSILNLLNVSKKFPDGTCALRNVSLEIKQGEFTVILEVDLSRSP